MIGVLTLIVSAIVMRKFCYLEKEYRLALWFLLLTNTVAITTYALIDDFYIYIILAVISLAATHISERQLFGSFYSYIFFSASYLLFAIDDMLLSSSIIDQFYYLIYYALTLHLVWSVSNVLRVRRRVGDCLRNLSRIAIRFRSAFK